MSLVIDRIDLLGLKSGLETEVLRELIAGPRTLRELVNLIFSTDRGHPDFNSSYTRVWRVIKQLESKGYVSSSLFRHEKTYRITRYGERCILGLVAGFPPPRVIRPIDIGIIGLTILLGIILLFDPSFLAELKGSLSAFFLVFLGVSFCRVATILREVG